ncbi:Clp protease N-terminal domain-containing protein [Streptomyces sp. NPDC006610]|uniref:Clp protease N-terminal domain-containing protein n=1 Tax=Streptomyces sp. NPDC006610 TaxID=3154584 RepID=UPI0033B03039
MFERFTKDARNVVKGALEHCERSGAGTVGAGHLLLALLDHGAGKGAFALAALGLAERTDSVTRALEEARRRAGLTQAEADALAGLGIDVTEVVARVEETHGVGALSGAWRPGRRRPSFGRDAKDVLEKSLRVALARRERYIGDEHILLALTTLPGVAAEVLADHGVTYESVTRVLGEGGAGSAAKAG